TNDANAKATCNSGGVGARSTSDAEATINSPADAGVGTGAVLSARTVKVNAQGGTIRRAQAIANSTSGGVGAATNTTTVLTTTYTSHVGVAENVSLTGLDLVQLSADSGAINLTSKATGTSNAIGPNSPSATTNPTYGATVAAFAGNRFTFAAPHGL